MEEQSIVATEAVVTTTQEMTTFAVEDVENQNTAVSATTKSGKKSTRKGKGDNTKSIRHQFGQQMDEWSQATKSKSPSPVKLKEMQNGKKSQRRKKNEKGTTRPKPDISSDCVVTEDTQSLPPSPASEEAVELLKTDSLPGKSFEC